MHLKFKTQIPRALHVMILLGIILALFGLGCLIFGPVNVPTVRAQPPETPEPNSAYFTSRTTTLSNGTRLEEYSIQGPPQPPPGYDLERARVTLPKSNPELGIKTLPVPAYSWAFGCSATSAAMIAAYYDRNGFPNIYTGPTSGGVMPMDSSSWPLWTDGYGGTYSQNPLTASRNGLDGRTTRGSFDDYWVKYMGGFKDPYITNGWAQHTWGDAIGDYMKTSQSAFANDDGVTTFWWYMSSAPLPCSTMESWGVTNDATDGRKLFYQARGYTVTDCYSQHTDNQYSGGFSFAQYKAEIDAGRPVMLELEGHTVVGVGYDDSTNTIYIHDTWDYGTYTMPWGGSFAGMALLVASIVNLQPVPSVVENEDPNIQYDGWRGVIDSNANDGTYRVSKVNNDKATFKFTGTSVTWVTEKGPDQGKAQVAIDGVAKGTFDLYSDTAQWNVQQTFNGLAYKAHTLVVKVLGTRNKSSTDANVTVDAFIVGSSTTQENSPSVQYNTWMGVLDSNASGGSYRSSATANALTSLTFTGTSINWITAMGPAYGKAQVLIDKNIVETADLYAVTQEWQVVKTYGNLSAGQHTIQIKVLGTKNTKSKGKTVLVDAFSGLITTTSTSVPVEPQPEETSGGDSSWLFGMLPLGMVGFINVRRRRQAHF